MHCFQELQPHLLVLCLLRCVSACCCRLGAGVKVINCVLMDNVTVGDGSHIQNCVVCSGAVIQERATLKDCQVGCEGCRAVRHRGPWGCEMCNMCVTALDLFHTLLVCC